MKLPTPPRGEATYLTAERRRRELDGLADGEAVDVLVVGGGITGVGVALDAVTRGLSVALLERGDLATGTSRFSSKLAHGGLRYLAKLQFGVAWESARERATLAKVTAPHMVRALPQLTPVYGRIPPPTALALETGIRMGDAMRALSGTSRRRLPGARRVAAAEARLWAPSVRVDELRGAILSWDGQLEDDARLVVALARTAAGHGARVCTYSEVVALTPTGARCRDVLTDATFDVRARHVINATGVWADTL
ncbi:MAG TPA: FAD-dependent oxidoreductase, partial [Solirubrobacteraceae bacterium]